MIFKNNLFEFCQICYNWVHFIVKLPCARFDILGYLYCKESRFSVQIYVSHSRVKSRSTSGQSVLKSLNVLKILMTNGSLMKVESIA